MPSRVRQMAGIEQARALAVTAAAMLHPDQDVDGGADANTGEYDGEEGEPQTQQRPSGHGALQCVIEYFLFSGLGPGVAE
jgi:hypothetical protein